MFAPVTNRGEAIGVLELRLGEAPDEQMLAEVALAAHALAYVVIANRRFTDLFEWGQRSVPLSLAAEIQHRLLPGAYTCEAGQFTLAGWLEPAGNVGGDTFDFAHGAGHAALSMTDAMGHEVDAALLATLLVGGPAQRAAGGRRTRRAGTPWPATGSPTTRRDGGFVTGQVGRIDLRTGTATIVNAGHPLPLRLRDGRVERVDSRPTRRSGPCRGHEYRVQPCRWSRATVSCSSPTACWSATPPASTSKTMVAAGAEMHPREAVQHLIQAILAGDRRRAQRRRDRDVPRLARRTRARPDDRLRRQSFW